MDAGSGVTGGGGGPGACGFICTQSTPFKLQF